jgi:hypothetical protein
MTGFIARAILRGATEVAGVASAESKLAGGTQKLFAEASELLAGKTVAPAVTEAGGRIAATAGTAERQTLTLSRKIDTAGGSNAERASTTAAGGSTDVVGRPYVARQFQPSAFNRPGGFSEERAFSYVSELEASQAAILKHNMRVSQAAIFPHMRARLDAIVGNQNLRLFSTQDLSAADHIGADYLLVRNGFRGAKGFNPKEGASVFPVDVKAMGTFDRMVPTARAKGVMDYPTDVFRKTNDKWELNDRALSFREFIDKSANSLARLGSQALPFDLRRFPIPSFRLEPPQKALADVSKFQETLLQSSEMHMPAFGKHLNGTLRHLQSKQAQSEYALMSRLR